MGRKKAKSRPRPVPTAHAAPRPPLSMPAAFWWIVVVAAAVRALFGISASSSPTLAGPALLDPEYYDAWARRILAGQPGGVFHGLPLYPYFLSLVYGLFGGSALAARVLQGALGVGTVVFTFLIARRLHSERAAIVAGAFAAVYGPLFFHETLLIPESLGVPLYAAAFYAALRFSDDPTAKKGTVLGVLSALASLTKPGLLLFAVAWPLWTSLRARRWAAGLACVAALAVTIAPVPLHNRVRGNDDVFLTSHGGFNFYVGNNPEAQGVFSQPEGLGGSVESQIDEVRSYAEAKLGRPLKPSEVSRYWSDRAKTFIRENPGRFAALCVKKLALLFDAREISDVADYRYEKLFVPFLKVPWPTFAVLGPFVLLGLVLVGRKGRYAGAVYLLSAVYAAGLMLFFVNDRYRLPLLPIWIPVAALAAVESYDALRARRWAAGVLYAAALAAGVAVTQLRLVEVDASRFHVNTGDILMKKEDALSALRHYEEGLRINPHSHKAHLAMGTALTKLGRAEEAKAHYERSMAVRETPSALVNLGLYHNAKGDPATAERFFLRALELKPNSSQAYNNLGMIYGNRMELDKAKEMFEKSLRINPQSPRALTNYGMILYKEGRRREAARHWEAALQVDPSFEDARRLLERSGSPS